MDSSVLSARAYGVRPSYGWPDGVIYYKYDSKHTMDVLNAGVTKATKDWNNYAPYLSFVEDIINPEPQDDVVTISFTSYGGISWSNVAMAGLHESHRTPAMTFSSTADAAVFRHEWGHQLGLDHEHERPDREDYVHFNCSALTCGSAYFCSQHDCCKHPKTDCYSCSTQFNIDRDKEFLYRKGGYDISSIMQYPGDLFSKPGQYTLTKVSDGQPVPRNTEISPGDVEGVCGIYKDLCDAYTVTKNGQNLQNTTGWSFAAFDLDRKPVGNYSSLSLRPFADSKYVNVTGTRTVNTKCQHVTYGADKTGSVPSGAALDFSPAPVQGDGIQDSCCLRTYSDPDCDESSTGKSETWCDNVSTTSDIFTSWRVFNCTGI